MSTLRSWLFVPGDSDKKLSKGIGCGADALILDLEDSVAKANKSAARQLVRSFLLERPRSGRKSQLWVRINPLDSPDALPDLAAVIVADPDGVVLPKANGPSDVLRLSHYLDALFGIAVVLTHEDDGELPDRRQIHRLVERADVARPVAEIADGDTRFSDL